MRPSLRRLVILAIAASITTTVIANAVNANDTGQPAGDDEEVDLLKWALKHSDPDALRDQAEENQKADDPDAAERIARAAAFLQAASGPSEAQLMEEALAVLANASAAAIDERLAALQALEVLVEPIDNADHLLKIQGGVAVLVELLGTAPALEAASARVLAVAASNNAPFQSRVLTDRPDVVLRLVQLLGAAAEDTMTSALHAAGQLVRNTPQGRLLWAEAGGGDVLVLVVQGGKQASVRARIKALALATDLLAHAEGSEGAEKLAVAVASVLREQAAAPGQGAKLELMMVEKAVLAAEAVQSCVGGGQALRQADGAAAVERIMAALKKEPQSEYVADIMALGVGLLRKIDGVEGQGGDRRDEL